MRTRTGTLCLLLVLLAAAAPARATRINVTVQSNTYTPSIVSATVGDTIHFTDTSGTHTVTNGTGSGDPMHGMLFNVTLTVGQFWDYVTTYVDTIPFYCVPHEFLNMKGSMRIVACPNGAPVIQSIGSQMVNENQLLTVTPTGSDPNGDPLTWSGSSLPSGASVNPGTGVLTWTPDFTQAGMYPGVTITATDNKTCNATTSVMFTITVNNVNRSPQVTAIGPQNVDENTLLSVVPTGSDPDGDMIAWSGSSLPSGASVNTSTGEFTWTPTTGQAGFYPGVTVIATDPGLLTGQASFDITVNAQQTGVGTANPTRFGVSAPSPFANRISFVVASPSGGRVEASVLSAKGQLVARIPARDVPAGWTTLSWNGAGLDGRPAAGGVYMLRVVSGEHAVTQRVVKLQ